MYSIDKVLPPAKHSSSSSKEATTTSSLIVTSQLTNEQKKLVATASNIPPYGSRGGTNSWKPQGAQDFGDGGAYPEIHVAQYPFGKGKMRSSRAGGGNSTLTVKLDSEGNVDYGAIARQGHAGSRIVQTSYQDLIPLRQRAGGGGVSLSRPSQEEVDATTERTKAAIEKIVSGKIDGLKASSSLTAAAKKPGQATYVRYTPSQNALSTGTSQQRVIKMVDVAQDPLAPPKFKHTKVPAGPPSPPAPVLRSPPRKLTAKDQEDWYIPPSVSNWKNPKGFTIALDKRLAAEGRGLQEAVVNDNMAKLSEALYAAERAGREEIRQRAAMQQKLAEQEAAAKEERMRKLAQQAREEKAAAMAPRRARDSRSPSPSYSRSRSPRRYSESRSRSPSRSRRYSGSRSRSPDSIAAQRRAEERAERRREHEKELRLSRMGDARRVRMLARDQDRDISEKVALGVAKPSKLTGEAQFDSRLFSAVSTTGLGGGFNEDQVYDKALFASHEAVRSIYRPKASLGADDDEDGDAEMRQIRSEKRFEGLGASSSGEGLVAPSEGPVEFVKDPAGRRAADPFGVEQVVESVDETRKYGLDKR